MPEEGIETQELKEKLEELGERPEGGASWLLWLSLSTAILAVLAAVASLESGGWANDALVDKNDAVLHQSKADDEWAHYQAMGIKAVVYATQAESTSSPEVAGRLRREADREKAGQTNKKDEAEKEQAIVDEKNEASAHALHVHHEFAKSVTIFQVAIALGAIGALTRRRSMWWLSLAVGAAGAAFFVLGLVHA